MKEYRPWAPTTSGGDVTQTTEAEAQWEQADLLLSRLSEDLRTRRVPMGLTLAQSAALTRAQAALDTYSSFSYPQAPRLLGGSSR
jgi:hypothetical protein